MILHNINSEKIKSGLLMYNKQLEMARNLLIIIVFNGGKISEIIILIISEIIILIIGEIIILIISEIIILIISEIIIL